MIEFKLFRQIFWNGTNALVFQKKYKLKKVGSFRKTKWSYSSIISNVQLQLLACPYF